MVNINKLKLSKNFKLSDMNAADKTQVPNSKFEREHWLKIHSLELDELQNRFYAEQNRKLLIILQGMDSSGKDGTIRNVFHDVNLLGISTRAFKAPTHNELARDFLWRIHHYVPEKGKITIFNRSHYEDVLVTYVKGWINQQQLEQRIQHIRHFEQMLSETGTTIIKLFLHISKDEQKLRIQKRLDNPKKHWKFDSSDLEDRKLWDKFQQQYEYVMKETSTSYAPWYIIPADSKSTRNVYVMSVLLEYLRNMDLKYPVIDTTGWPKLVE